MYAPSLALYEPFSNESPNLVVQDELILISEGRSVTNSLICHSNNGISIANAIKVNPKQTRMKGNKLRRILNIDIFPIVKKLIKARYNPFVRGRIVVYSARNRIGVTKANSSKGLGRGARCTHDFDDLVCNRVLPRCNKESRLGSAFAHFHSSFLSSFLRHK